jgi:hypothetical protein
MGMLLSNEIKFEYCSKILFVNITYKQKVGIGYIYIYYI